MTRLSSPIAIVVAVAACRSTSTAEAEAQTRNTAPEGAVVERQVQPPVVPTTMPAEVPSQPRFEPAEKSAEVPSRPPSEPAGKPDAVHSHDGFTVGARLVDATEDGEPAKTLEIRFSSDARAPRTAALQHGTVSICDHVEVSIEPVPSLRDDRLAMLNLFCENGEDSFSRGIVTALVFVGDADSVWSCPR